MSFLKNRAFVGNMVLGLVASLITLIVFSVDRISFLSWMHPGTSAFNYGVIIVSFWILFAMNFMVGVRRSYETSLTYIAFMALYDLVTNDLATILFAIVSLLSLILGLGVSFVAVKLGIIGRKESQF